MKWGNDRISKNQLENPGGSSHGNGGKKETINSEINIFSLGFKIIKK